MTQTMPVLAAMLAPGALLVAARLVGVGVVVSTLAPRLLPLRFLLPASAGFGLLLWPLLAGAHAAVPTGAMVSTPTALAGAMVLEAIAGAVITFLATLPLAGARMSGHLAGQPMGLAFASLYDPVTGDDTGPLGRLFLLLGVVMFLLVGGHEALVRGILGSFEHLPAGRVVAGDGLLEILPGMLGAAFELALRVAFPVVVVLMLLGFLLEFVIRTAPQFNLLSHGFPMRILLGLCALVVGLPVTAVVLRDGIDELLRIVLAWAGVA